MRKKVIITISGKAEAGKDTFGNTLAFHFMTEKYRVLRLNYADWLKKIMEKLVGYREEDKKKWRSELQRVGTEVARAYNQTYWSDIAVGAFEMLGDEADVMIIADARFRDEIELSKWRDRFPVVNILIKREEENHLDASQRQHASETTLDTMNESDFDFVINNDKAINDLYMIALKVKNSIREKYLETTA